MSRVIKAACVQLKVLNGLPDDEQLVPMGHPLVRKIALEEAEQQARALVEKAENQVVELLAEADRRAEQIKAEAETQIQSMRLAAMHEAAAEAEQLKARAYQEGYEDGLLRGMEEGRCQAAGAISSASELLRESQARAKQRLCEGEAHIIELATALARRIIGQELTTTPEKAVTMAQQMLQRLEETPSAVLRVAREILPLYRERLEKARVELRELVEIEVLGDPLLSAGDFLIDTPSGTVDGRLDAQLDVLRKALLNLSRERARHHD